MTIGPHVRRRHGRWRCCRRGGFTLLELVLVMLIVCTVLAMAAPSLHGFFASRQTEDAAARIVGLAHLARSQAVSEGRVYRLHFDLRGGTYRLTAQEGGRFERLSNEFGRTFALPEGTSAELLVAGAAAGREYVSFYPNGRADAAGIRLTGKKGKVIQIECPSPSERFRIAVPAQEQE